MTTPLLVDTHVLAWVLLDPSHLARPVADLIADRSVPVFVSAVCAWEAATKHHLGKWPDVGPVVAQWDELMERLGCLPLPITAAHAVAAAGLGWPHRDPFDRLLVAQARVERFRLVTADPILLGFVPDALPAR